MASNVQKEQMINEMEKLIFREFIDELKARKTFLGAS